MFHIKRIYGLLVCFLLVVIMLVVYQSQILRTSLVTMKRRYSRYHSDSYSAIRGFQREEDQADHSNVNTEGQDETNDVYFDVQDAQQTNKTSEFGDEISSDLSGIESELSVNKHQENLAINCENIHQVILGKKAGTGTRKKTFLGTFKGEKVAVKVLFKGPSFKNCVKGTHWNDTAKHYLCFKKLQVLMMKEILILQQLDDPSVVKLKGFCVRDDENPTSETDPRDHAILAVYEYAERYDVKKLTWRKKIETALQMADVVYYLEHSPFGSSRIKDFRRDNFRFVDGRLKLIDVDLWFSGEQKCRDNKQCRFHKDTSQCIMGKCEGLNAKITMRQAYTQFFNELLQCDQCPVKNELEELKQRISRSIWRKKKFESDEINAKQLQEKLQQILKKLHTL